MENKFIKALSVVIIALMGIGLAACGKGEGTVDEKDPVNAEKEYEYFSEFEELNLDISNGYISYTKPTKNGVAILETRYGDETGAGYGFVLHMISFENGEDSFVNLETSEQDLNSYATSVDISDDGTIRILNSLYKYETGEESYILVTYDKDGKKTGEKDITKALNIQSFIRSTAFDSKGNIYFALEDSINV